MWTIKETETLRQSIKMKLSQYEWYLGSYVVPDNEGYAIQVEVSKTVKGMWEIIPARTKMTSIKIYVKSNDQ